MRQHFPFIGLLFITYSAISLGLVLFLSGFHLVDPPVKLDKPDFANIENSQDKKLAFFTFLTPMIKDQNQRMLDTRERLFAIDQTFHETSSFSKRAQHYIERLVLTYRFEEKELSTEDQLKELLIRVDTIPIAMALAQAASESGWGSSRFAQTGNNFFGQWCYKKGCGLVPKNRVAGAQHEVAKFNSVRDSINSYFLNINTHTAYDDFRNRRKRVRVSGNTPRSVDLIPALLHYSERRQAYLDDLNQIIRTNNLTALEQS